MRHLSGGVAFCFDGVRRWPRGAELGLVCITGRFGVTVAILTKGTAQRDNDAHSLAILFIITEHFQSVHRRTASNKTSICSICKSTSDSRRQRASPPGSGICFSARRASGIGVAGNAVTLYIRVGIGAIATHAMVAVLTVLLRLAQSVVDIKAMLRTRRSSDSLRPRARHLNTLRQRSVRNPVPELLNRSPPAAATTQRATSLRGRLGLISELGADTSQLQGGPAAFPRQMPLSASAPHRFNWHSPVRSCSWRSNPCSCKASALETNGSTTTSDLSPTRARQRARQPSSIEGDFEQGATYRKALFRKLSKGVVMREDRGLTSQSRTITSFEADCHPEPSEQGFTRSLLPRSHSILAAHRIGGRGRFAMKAHRVGDRHRRRARLVDKRRWKHRYRARACPLHWARQHELARNPLGTRHVWWARHFVAARRVRFARHLCIARGHSRVAGGCASECEGFANAKSITSSYRNNARDHLPRGPFVLKFRARTSLSKF
eukprot:TRINITY_DN67917_c0_g1_i1.p1 TRINITY_DN67917_c0_g1~~TRINITY_DN67917_c0_g1_i1.p1  ORF type:complete len:492 (+),score=35.07 TRINITY_DN67917_c0_g1_i1:68-1543(+)